MRDHGCTVTGTDLKETVRETIYLLVNARILTKAMQMGEPKFLTDKDIERATSRKKRVYRRRTHIEVLEKAIAFMSLKKNHP